MLAKYESTVANAPINKELPTVTYPHAGVIATIPTTIPLHAPTGELATPMIRSINTHVSIPEAPAVLVVATAWHAKPPAVNAEPPLKASHPNHRNAVP